MADTREQRVARALEKAMKMPRIECGCGCGEQMLALTRDGKPRRFIAGHTASLAHAARTEKAADAAAALGSVPRFSGRPACANAEPELFWGSRDPAKNRAKNARAKRVCARCPVISECLSWALAHGERGVWGGTTAEQRGHMRARGSREQAA